MLRERISQTSVLMACVATLGLGALCLARERTKVDTFLSMGDIWSFIRFQADRPAVFVEVDPHDFSDAPVPAIGDTLLTIAGSPATAARYFEVFNPQTPAGRHVPIQFKRDERIVASTVMTRSVPRMLRLQVTSLFLLRSLLALALIAAGLWIFIRQRRSVAVRVLALFCFALAAGLVVDPNIIASYYATMQIPYEETLMFLMRLFANLAPVFWVKLHLVFPDTRRFPREHPVWTHLLLFAPILGLAPFLQANRETAQVIAAIHRLVFLAFGFFLLVGNWKRARTWIARRQTWLVLMGAVPGLTLYALMPGLILLVRATGGAWNTLATLYSANATFLLLLLLPVTCVYAMGRYRLLEIQGRIKRTTRFMALNGILLLLFASVLYWITKMLLQTLAGGNCAIPLAAGLLFVLLLAPVLNRIRRIACDWLFPERRRLQLLLNELQRDPGLARTAPTYWQEIVERLTKSLGARSVQPVFPGDRFLTQPADGLIPAHLHAPEGLFEQFARIDHPLFIDEIHVSGQLKLEPEHLRWLEARGTALVLPLVTSAGLIGLLLIGPKRGGEDYSPEEIFLLRSLAAQAALTLENIHLLEESLERQKLKDQLALGRQVQEGLLPGELPRTPGLTVAAKIRFSLEVCGDYYDVIPLAGRRTLLAIGDVAGKGVGAALIMSNLQALLRSVRGREVKLAELVHRINSVVYENTPVELFITFFAMIFDPDTHRILYVNAGHNHPFLKRADGRIERLDKGGLMLGFMPDVAYAEGEAQLQPGDMLLMFTDGASEAADAEDRLFGEERIGELLADCHAGQLDACLATIEDAVCEHTGQEHLEDDFTLLVAGCPTS